MWKINSQAARIETPPTPYLVSKLKVSLMLRKSYKLIKGEYQFGQRIPRSDGRQDARRDEKGSSAFGSVEVQYLFFKHQYSHPATAHPNVYINK